MIKLLEILDCKYPIIQGPIGQLNDPKMIAAVSEAGAFGVLALGFITDVEKGLAGASVQKHTVSNSICNL